MVKVKNKKNFGLADKLHVKKNKHTKQIKHNPFEVHINKEKYKVLGKKSKNDWGLPGVSRAKAIKKRKNTIGHELKLVNKTNTFMDRRIGEKNVAITNEDKAMARFTAERIQQHKLKSEKKNIYNLAEEEILTHRGQTLGEIEKFDDPKSDDEYDDDMLNKSGKLEDDFVADANFGGGVLSRNESKDGPMSRKQLIEQLILESKKRKIEKQKLKEETLDLTEKLDSEWKDLQPIVAKDFNKEVEKNKQEKPEKSIIEKVMSDYEKKNEEYDKTMRELKFEPRGTPSDKLKSEDEIAKIEKDKLEKLEQDRLKRMQGVFDTSKSKAVPKHRSADDLDDDFAAELDEDNDLAVVYDADGNAVIKNNEENGEEESNGEEEENEQEEEEEDENEEGSGEESDDSLDDLKQNDVQSDDDDGEHTQKKHEDKNIVTKKVITKENEKIITENNKENTVTALLKDSESDKIKSDLLVRKCMMEKAAAELPYTFQMPKDYDSLHDLLSKYSPDHQHIIIERMIKCNHPKLGEENKKKLNTLFAYLLQYINDLFTDDIDSNDSIVNSFKCFDRLCSHIYDLAQMDPTNAKNCVEGVIKEKYEEFKKSSSTYPQLDTLIFFKLISLIFPTSDLKHPIVTPCFIFMSEILNKCKVRKNTDVAKGLFLSTLVLEYVSLSKRLLPEAINFIKGILFLSIPTDLEHKYKIVFPFKRFGPLSNLLVLQNNVDDKSFTSDKLKAACLIDDSENDDFKISALVTAVKIFDEFFQQSSELSAREAIYGDHIKFLRNISLDKYPKQVSQLVSQIVDKCNRQITQQKLEPILVHKKTKMLKLYEPSFDSEFSGRKKRNVSKEKIEHEKLIHKHKKEMKGALREIRRDKAYISSVKIKDKIQSDNMRKDKVKRIYSEASIQQGELNALQRSKKKKK